MATATCWSPTHSTIGFCGSRYPGRSRHNRAGILIQTPCRRHTMISAATETRSITIETEVAASPERVWQALTIPEELMRWFPLEAKVVPGLGGTMTLSWGYPVVAESTIDVWEPGRRLRTTESRPFGILLQP